MDTVVSYVQLVANLSALTIIGWIYVAYVKSLRAQSVLKDTQIETVERNLQFWRDKAEALEKKTPEHLERVLADRIRIREEEVARLKEDMERHGLEIQERHRELLNLKLELQKAKDVGRSIVVYDSELDDEVVVPSSELELIKLGEVFVDSASLMITDPMYIKSDWHEEEYSPHVPKYVDVDTSGIYEFRKDFKHYDEKVSDIGKSANELVASGRWVEVEEDEDPARLTMSYAGAGYASGGKRGYGSLRFKHGEEGAGICIRTVHGDGTYPVYGEKHKGHIVRVYVDLQ